MRSVLDQTLDELEQVTWGEPAYDSHLVATAHRLRRKPLKEFTVEDLRLMIGQAIGLPYLIPLALARLEADALAEGDCYPGDLLASVIRNRAWLKARPHIMARVQAVARRPTALAGDDPDLRGDIARFLAEP